MSELTGQVALVTGAGSGLGQGIALELASAGAHIAIVDRDERAARETLAMLTDLKLDGRAYGADVTKRIEVDSTWDSVANDFGHLDIVVNNAGVSFVGPHIIDTTDEAWHTSIDVMQTGVFYAPHVATALWERNHDFVDSRLFFESGARRVLRGEGGGLDDDSGCRRRMGGIRSSGERDCTGPHSNTDVGERCRERCRRRRGVSADHSGGPSRYAVGGRTTGCVSRERPSFLHQRVVRDH